ncbi:MAG: hypothetical protein GON13_03600 [Nanoarchaeota archaeon]|nr:hypothetical protein [Nanoarchaeota archaeon]
MLKTVLLEELGVRSSSRNVGLVVRAYEKRYGGKVGNWKKLEQDIRIILNSKCSNKKLLSRAIIKEVLDNGLNHIYVSDDSVCAEFRKSLFKAKRDDFMLRVQMIFN